LATAGTGDVLAGIIGALLANRMADETSPPVSLARIAAAGVVVHSIAAERASNGGPFMLAGLVEQIPRGVADLLSRNQGYEP
jgi:NAD(P)H-hydrate repair Nnr-like enzyme with NAD(P)H-hydrate dehydratase domain